MQSETLSQTSCARRCTALTRRSRRLETQGHPQIDGKFKASPRYRRPCLKEINKDQRKANQALDQCVCGVGAAWWRPLAGWSWRRQVPGGWGHRCFLPCRELRHLLHVFDPRVLHHSWPPHYPLCPRPGSPPVWAVTAIIQARGHGSCQGGRPWSDRASWAAVSGWKGHLM